MYAFAFAGPLASWMYHHRGGAFLHTALAPSDFGHYYYELVSTSFVYGIVRTSRAKKYANTCKP